MIEKVNPCHPDKIADRIAGAIVDLAYKKANEDKIELIHPKVACEVLIGHGNCHIINETSEHLTKDEVKAIVSRIAGEMTVDYKEYKQDKHLAENQSGEAKCGDNGIFKAIPLTQEEKDLSEIARTIYWKYRADGKYILDKLHFIICQSNANTEEIKELYPDAYINPLGEWKGGTNVDTGATNRKLGSDMASSVTGGGLHGKDLTKADVSINIYLHLLAEKTHEEYDCCCAIGDKDIIIKKHRSFFYTDYIQKPYKEIIEEVSDYINKIGGFEKLAEWGLF